MVFCSVELVPPKQAISFRKQGPPEAIPFYGAVLFGTPGAVEMRTAWQLIIVSNQVITPPTAFAGIANVKAYFHAAPGCRIRFTVVKALGTIPNNAPFELMTG